MYANDIFAKRFVSTTYKELLELNTKKTTQLKMGKESAPTSLQRRYINGQ